MIGHRALRPRLAGALTAGVDEAGRGPLAGPVFAAAVILDPRRPVRGLRDSKELAPEDRDRLAVGIRLKSAAWAIGWADAAEIDVLNILEATLLAMRRALLGLPLAPRRICVDGNRCPGRSFLGLDCELEAIIGGDARVREISAASILAKTDGGPLPRLWFRAPQGLSHGGAFRDPGPRGPLPAPPAEFRTHETVRFGACLRPIPHPAARPSSTCDCTPSTRSLTVSCACRS